MGSLGSGEISSWWVTPEGFLEAGTLEMGPEVWVGFGFKKGILGVPTVVQWDRRHLGSTGMQAPSWAWPSGLGIRRGRSIGVGETGAWI